MLQTGAILDGRYRILGTLGRGGTSCVYLAENIRIGKKWAIKQVFKNNLGPAATGRNGLIAESAILTKLRHPSLPAIIDVLDSQQAYFIVMEYIEGRALNTVLEQQGAQPEALVLKWAKQLCEVLQYLHSQKPAIIYRDIKPANIMLKPDGNITLIDFGAARELKKTQTSDTMHLGTHGYAAPEQYTHSGQSDARTDIYCLGVTLYHLVTGNDPCRPPYDIQPIRQINPSLSLKLERVIEKCTQLQPDDRFQSADNLLRELSGTQSPRVFAYEFDEEDVPKKKAKWVWLLTLIPVLFIIIVIFVILFVNKIIKDIKDIGNDNIRGYTQGDYNTLQSNNYVVINYENEHVVFEFTPAKTGVYDFYSSSGAEVPIAWLLDDKDKILCDSNTYGTYEDFDFSYRLTKNKTYYLEVALYSMEEEYPKTGYLRL